MSRTTRNPFPCEFLELPVTPYSEAWHLQLAIVAGKKQGTLTADVVLLLEHPPVFTLGRRGGMENLTVSKDVLEKSDAEVVQVERGGDITFHGPGQIVVYPIIDLNRRRLGVMELVSGMEDVMIRTAEAYGVASFHGFAFNVNPSLSYFDWIHPCGLKDIGMTSLKKELGDEPSIKDVRQAVVENLKHVFALDLKPITRNELNLLLKQSA
ncbi:MAG: lipoyl(octanoyl) transferase LipB [Deltaproteobacteria bacterium]